MHPPLYPLYTTLLPNAPHVALGPSIHPLAREKSSRRCKIVVAIPVRFMVLPGHGQKISLSIALDAVRYKPRNAALCARGGSFEIVISRHRQVSREPSKERSLEGFLFFDSGIRSLWSALSRGWLVYGGELRTSGCSLQESCLGFRLPAPPPIFAAGTRRVACDVASVDHGVQLPTAAPIFVSARSLMQSWPLITALVHVQVVPGVPIEMRRGSEPRWSHKPSATGSTPVSATRMPR
jgi:hypothetical protein